MSIIGLQMYTLRDHVKTKEDFLETLRKVSEIGYTMLQCQCPAFMDHKEFYETLASFGLHIDSVFYMSNVIEEKIDEICDATKLHNTRYVRIESMPYEDCLSPEGFLRYSEKLEKLGAFLTAHGLKLLYHFHAFEFVNFPDGKRGIDIMLENTTAENVWFQPDIFWLTAAGTEASESISMFKGRAKSIHVKDFGIKIRAGQELELIPFDTLPVGCGNLNWKRIIPAAIDAGIESFVIEQDWCSTDVFEAVKKSYDNLKAMGLGE